MNEKLLLTEMWIQWWWIHFYSDTSIKKCEQKIRCRREREREGESVSFKRLIDFKVIVNDIFTKRKFWVAFEQSRPTDSNGNEREGNGFVEYLWITNNKRIVIHPPPTHNNLLHIIISIK